MPDATPLRLILCLRCLHRVDDRRHEARVVTPAGGEPYLFVKTCGRTPKLDAAAAP